MGEREDGATSVEYGLTAGLVAVVIVVSVSALGGAVAAQFQSFMTAMGW
jgi:pilus assembly protein Flp/PilA